MKLLGEFFALDLNARREGEQLVSVASFRMDGRQREYQVEVRLPAGGSWFRDILQVELPESWGDTATRTRFAEELTWFIRAAAGRCRPGNYRHQRADDQNPGAVRN